MPTVKSSATLLAATSNAAAGTTNSTTQSIATSYGAIATGTMVNGATAPTIGCTATLQVSLDGTTFDTWMAATASTTASAVTPFAFEVPMHVLQFRVSFSGNTGQAVTCLCRAQWTTAI